VIQITPQMRILVAVEPADFRNGIDGLGGVCRKVLRQDPLSGCVFVFRNRRGTAIKILVYDGQGFWLCQKRLSQGRFQWWPARNASHSDVGGPESAVEAVREGVPEGMIRGFFVGPCCVHFGKGVVHLFFACLYINCLFIESTGRRMERATRRTKIPMASTRADSSRVRSTPDVMNRARMKTRTG